MDVIHKILLQSDGLILEMVKIASTTLYEKLKRLQFFSGFLGLKSAHTIVGSFGAECPSQKSNLKDRSNEKKAPSHPCILLPSNSPLRHIRMTHIII